MTKKSLSAMEDEPMMQACFYTKFGKPTVLQMGLLPKAKLLAPEEVLVQVYAASINPIDYKRREGGLKAVLDTKWPQIVGYDLAGVVVLVGANVKQFHVGDEVYACLPHDRPGSLAEYSVLHLYRRLLALTTVRASFVQAAALPISSLVALQTLRRLELREGQKFLLTGGSGGVGTLALQLAKNVFKAGTIATTAARLHRHHRHSAGEVAEASPRVEIKPRKLSHIQVVKMGNTSSRAIEGEAIATDITEELRSAAPNIGRDVIALSTTATPVQVSMSPQEEMLNHVHLEKALKNHATDDMQKSFVKELLARGGQMGGHSTVTETKHHWFIAHPHGKVRLRWDVMCIVLIFYNAIIIPFQAAFQADGSGSVFDSEVNYVIDTIFGLDILSNFVTGVDIKGKVHFQLQVIAKRYVLSWFLVDFLSTFPFTAVVSGSDPTIRRALKLFRLIRLLRLFRMLRILNRLQHALLIRSTISSLFRYCLTVVFISHWFACFFFWVSYQDSMFEMPPINTWLKEKNLLHETMWDQYVAALYWAVMTLATVGYGDVSGISPNERCFTIFAMFAGAGIFAYGITNIVSLVSSLTAHETAFREKMDEINEYMAARDLPRPLRIEIREFFQNARKSKENDMLQEQELLNELSAMLRSKIALAINDHFLWKFPFFKGSDPNFIMDLALSMRLICFAPFEDVCVEGELGHEMFFVFRGAVEVLKDNVQITVLGENQYFGEMAILNRDCKRMATVRTLCFCELRMLSRVRFLEALVHFPKMMEKLANYSKARANGITQPGGAFAPSRPDSEGSSGRAVRRKSSMNPRKAAGYRLNWRNPRMSDPKLGDANAAETIVQLDHIKRVQDLLSTKVREMHAMVDAMTDPTML
ncbi:hypothetical protein SPRG_21220 [Saprolegnia parasitica CBS 223.65]|uniref:Cyclic nucleotide-binding domain-containing protein n=1 Tax=Saprolegnia parasitica (strain CBS 223.65) TaxID=695850 RepID=A0A067C3P2_SAPPC|nr:hypothetical protein SPRG_21220 [Saprolegnia parasitica CBS 223.65]KDO21161.1 hypothetical protein SPRG_21220 [Saprolegnia parasitica CBS 223.65]|eukprot:XP_012208171.1 hypothetical protein SPRG_21220 [Saprolegnia parasitica CBS 223.65]